MIRYVNRFGSFRGLLVRKLILLRFGLRSRVSACLWSSGGFRCATGLFWAFPRVSGFRLVFASPFALFVGFPLLFCLALAVSRLLAFFCFRVLAFFCLLRLARLASLRLAGGAVRSGVSVLPFRLSVVLASGSWGSLSCLWCSRCFRAGSVFRLRVGRSFRAGRVSRW